jgi:RHS repeat-associated protein
MDRSTNKTGAADSANSRVELPSVSLPKGGGAIRGIGEKFAANQVSGTGSLSIPISTSPGRSDFGPQLSLSYDSGAGNGPFGLGWTLSLPSITRKTDKGLPQYCDAEESDVYILSGSEDLVPMLQPDGSRFEDSASAPGYTIHRYRPRVEGLFARIERWTHQATGNIHWRSIARDNVTTLYGKTAESRIAAPGDPGRVFTWLICESHDDKGNAIVYEYALENDVNVELSLVNERNRTRTANRYLKRIRYGNRISRLVQPDLTVAQWMFDVVFDYDEGHYEELGLNAAQPEAEQHRFVRAAASPGRPWTVRPDPFSSHRSGFEVRTYRRCRRILMFHRFAELGDEPYLVRATEFEFRDLDYSKPTTIEAELAHRGSTRFASFVHSITQSGFVRDSTQPVLELNGVKYLTYLKKSMPPLEFEYSKVSIQDNIRGLDAASLENLPVGLDGANYRWVDLEGEGVSGILTEQADAWFYKPSLGQGDFGPMRHVARKPSLAALSSGRQQLLDLAGDGRLDLAQLGGATPGFYERTTDEDWQLFKPFTSLPNIPWDDPNLRFVDLNGDGHADVLITEHETFIWYPSRAEEGFGPVQGAYQSANEEKGPRLVFGDGTQSIYLADMCGDGLTDLVRIRNGEVCYWPNLGYGRFGAKVSMDNAPLFDRPDGFDQERIRLADIDGSGVTDIVYLGREGVRLYFNQSGNRWSGPRHLRQFPHVDNLSSVTTVDLLGNGTACLVWSSPLPGDARRPLRYIDMMGGQKPHLLVAVINNLGAETRVHYAPSTKFYLADKTEGKPWITRLPFPVHVVERVETFDRVSRNRFSTRHAYHHGYFDGVEREFRGFGMVEQWDTEELATLSASDAFPAGDNIDAASHVPPVHTKSWFHTGVYLGHGHVSNFFAGLIDAQDRGEYYREPGLSDAQAMSLLLDDTALPGGLSVEEEREACRALKGSMLRQEVYALDGTDESPHPYTVTEQNFSLQRLQPQAGNRHAVFFTHARETINYHYERDPIDPRLMHTLTMEVDGFGNVLKEASIGYGRRQQNMDLSMEDRAKQTRTLITYTGNRVTNAIQTADDYRTPLLCQTSTYELTGYTPTGAAGRFQMSDFVQPDASDPSGLTLIHIFDSEIDYEDTPTGGKQRRLIEEVRTLYRENDLTGLLPLGTLESLALVGETYKLAFTPGLLAQVYMRPRSGQPPEDLLPDPTTVLPADVPGGQVSDRGGYIDLDGDGNWWIPTGRVFYSLNTGHTAAQELAFARDHFFLPHRYRNAFGPTSTVTYDTPYNLLPVETRDPVGNRITVGERNAAGVVTTPGHDYRVLQPWLVADANRNRRLVAFDALGMVVGTAITGKPGENLGDSLTGFEADLTEATLLDHLANPLTDPRSILGRATTRLVYDLFAYRRTRGDPAPQPAVVYTLSRETHDADLAPGEQTRIQHSFSYSDGFSREIQKKIQAEPERINGVASPPRWVGSGWTIFNNKGKPVRQYEPFFSATHRFEFASIAGVSPIMFYDPRDRVVAIVHPNHTYEKVLFSPWWQSTYDVNDTVLGDPRTDDEIGGFVSSYFASQPAGWQTWRAARISGALGAHEQSAAAKASAHADTPTISWLDTLGRTFLTVADNGLDTMGVSQLFHSRIYLDIEGNQREVRDAIIQNADVQGRIVMLYSYDMLGNLIRQASMESGERWMLHDVAGNPIRIWSSRGHTFRTAYDILRRPLRQFVIGSDPTNPATEVLTERLVYGEQHPQDEARNLRGALYLHMDQAGVTANEARDFKDNPARSSRRIAREYKQTVSWSAPDATLPADATAKLNLATLEAALTPQLEADTFASRTTFDALNRTIQVIAPRRDQPGARRNVIQPVYNEASLLERLHVWLGHPSEPAGLLDVTLAPPSAVGVSNIDYDAKGQRLRVEYKNGVTTRYTYDPETFRLVHLYTRRGTTFTEDCGDPPPRFAAPEAPAPGIPCGLQNLRYTYDPVGNITHIRDNAQQTVYFNNRRVEPSAAYTYDPIYRLTEATGREHLGQTGGLRNPPTALDAFNGFHTRLDHPNNGDAMGTYVESYAYDAVGNILSMQHRGSDPPHAGWTRNYTYSEASLLEPTKLSNCVSSTSVGGAGSPIERYRYDAHGNVIRMPHLANHPDPTAPNMHWNYKDQLRQTDVSGAGSAYYTYNAAGERVRKVWEKAPGLTEERIYLGGLEVFRRRNGAGTVTLERETLDVIDDKQRIAFVETRTEGNDPAPGHLIRYQLGNYLGSAILELDDQSQIISYEEYYPYGSTSYQAVRSQTETPKRYRYTGKERDEESGLYYNVARYYAPWLGRWTSCDPEGLVDGPNLYRYARDNPLTYSDPQGTDPPQDQNQGLVLGPLQVRNITGTLNANLSADFQVNNIWSSDRSLTINTLVLGGNLHLRSDLELPSFGMTGHGSYELNLDSLRVDRQFASAEIDGRATLSTGPFSLTLGVSGYGSTTLPPTIRLSDASEQLQASMDRFTGWVAVNGRVDVNNLAIGAFSISGDIGPGAQGSLAIRGTFGLPSLGDGPATVLGHISGTANFSGGQYNLGGSFQAGLFGGLPIPPFAVGTWSLDQSHGFRAQGHYVGPQFGPLGLNVGINPTGNVTQDTTQLRALDAMGAGSRGLGGITPMFEPGVSLGYSYFRYGEGTTTFLNVGVSPTSSAVPYYPGGLSQPLAGPSLGPYVGFQYRTMF